MGPKGSSMYYVIMLCRFSDPPPLFCDYVNTCSLGNLSSKIINSLNLTNQRTAFELGIDIFDELLLRKASYELTQSLFWIKIIQKKRDFTYSIKIEKLRSAFS